jgi:hypothetical protein
VNDRETFEYQHPKSVAIQDGQNPRRIVNHTFFPFNASHCTSNPWAIPLFQLFTKAGVRIKSAHNGFDLGPAVGTRRTGGSIKTDTSSRFFRPFPQRSQIWAYLGAFTDVFHEVRTFLILAGAAGIDIALNLFMVKLMQPISKTGIKYLN